MLFHLVAAKGLLEERRVGAEEADGDVDHGHHEDEDSRKSTATLKGSREGLDPFSLLPSRAPTA